MNWAAFWSGLLGTAIPAFVVSLIILYLTHRANRSMERYKKETGRNLTDHRLWHEKRVTSLLAIHDAFRKYLNFLRRALYVSPPKGLDVTPQHDFFDAIQDNLVYLNDDLRQKILSYQGELLQFWNWAATLRLNEGSDGWKDVQYRLDFEIPGYLEKLRQDINTYADPSFVQPEEKEK